MANIDWLKGLHAALNLFSIRKVSNRLRPGTLLTQHVVLGVVVVQEVLYKTSFTTSEALC